MSIFESTRACVDVPSITADGFDWDVPNPPNPPVNRIDLFANSPLSVSFHYDTSGQCGFTSLSVVNTFRFDLAKGWQWSDQAGGRRGDPNLIFDSRMFMGAARGVMHHEDYGYQWMDFLGGPPPNTILPKRSFPTDSTPGHWEHYRGYVNNYSDSASVSLIMGEVAVFDSSGTDHAPAWIAVPDSFGAATRQEVESVTRTESFVLPRGATVRCLAFLNLSDSVKPFWALGGGNALTFIVEIVDSASGATLWNLGSRHIEGVPWPGPPGNVGGHSMYAQVPIFSSPIVYLRVRAVPTGVDFARLRVDDIHRDSTLSVDLFADPFGKIRAPQRAGALPIVDDLHAAPNPAVASESFVRYSVYEQGTVTVTISDAIGRYRETLVSEPKSPGAYWAQLPTHGLQPGAYVIDVRVDGRLSARGMVMVVK